MARIFKKTRCHALSNMLTPEEKSGKYAENFSQSVKELMYQYIKETRWDNQNMFG
jgi:hypothetical protein